MLSRTDKLQFMERFPEIELSYDKILHNKVQTDLFLVIPKGRKALIWFTYFQNKNVCLLMILDKNNNINDMDIYPYCFSNELSFNTILYGTFNKHGENTLFVAEDILYYKNKNIQKISYIQRLNFIHDMFNDSIKNTNVFKNNLIIGLAVIRNNYETITNEINYLSYDVYGIQCRHSHKNYSEGILKMINRGIEVNFKVKAQQEQDIYHLYVFDENKRQNVYYNIAMINDYKTSVFMNDIFRKIKENKNLDLLEESDDEEEFENTSDNKFVDLNKEVLMKCVYMDKFRKWKPISVCSKGNSIITKREIYAIQKK
jgi:hypothetical protein